jgi:hypothetical protein
MAPVSRVILPEMSRCAPHLVLPWAVVMFRLPAAWSLSGALMTEALELALLLVALSSVPLKPVAPRHCMVGSV